MTTTPPGWYDDGHGALRWWDGAQWTEHVAQPDPEVSAAPTEAEIVASQQASGDQRTPSVPDGATLGEAAYAASAAAPGDTAAPHPAAGATAYAPTSDAQPGYAQPAYPQQGSPQPGFPQQGYPGADAGGGAFTAATEPRKSKLWIVWVVLGVVLLGIVIAAAVLIPLLILSVSSGNGAAQSDDERAAVAAVELYDDAWQNGDCDSLTAATTEHFRTASGFTDCATFEANADGFDDNFDDYEVRVTDVETVGDEITVTTNETYTALVDENGEPTDPAPGATVYHYTLVAADGGWAIDDLYNE
jgi:hypothetical protein